MVSPGFFVSDVIGKFQIDRKLLTSDLWLSEPFTRGQAWVDLIGLANHRDGFYRSRGVKVEVKRGQCGWSEMSLAKRWRWSRGKVRRFLNELKSVQQIEQQTTNVTSLISIINYDEYQFNSTTDGTANGHQTVQQTDTKRYTNNNDNNDKNEKNSKGIDIPLSTSPAKSGENHACPQQQIVDLYHDVLPEFPTVKIWSQKNQQTLRARWKSSKEYQSLEWWKSFFCKIRNSDFLMGQTKHEFQPDLEWLIKSSNFTKILNGRYENRNPNPMKGKVSDITAKNIESFRNWQPPEEKGLFG